MKPLLATLLLCAGPALGQAPSPATEGPPVPVASAAEVPPSPITYVGPPRRAPHEGFHLNLSLGYGAIAATGRHGAPDELRMSGGGVDFAVTAGGAPRPNLIVGCQLVVVGVSSPRATLGGAVRRLSDLAVVGMGPTLVYYLMPANVFLQVTPAIASVAVKSATTGVTARTRDGVGLFLGAGKEWIVNERWALGLAGHAFALSNQDLGTTVRSSGYGLVLSASLL